MKKTPSLFQRDYEGTRQVYDEVVPGSEWVLEGEGTPTVKYDGTACMIDDSGKFYKRYDRKRNKKTGEYKSAPEGWIPCELEPNEHTGHWPGWMPVGDGPEDKWLRGAYEHTFRVFSYVSPGTYEAVGPHFQGNPYNLEKDVLWRHGRGSFLFHIPELSFEGLREFFERVHIEGIVWHHPDGRMVKIKRKDFGLEWPIK